MGVGRGSQAVVFGAGDAMEPAAEPAATASAAAYRLRRLLRRRRRFMYLYSSILIYVYIISVYIYVHRAVQTSDSKACIACSTHASFAPDPAPARPAPPPALNTVRVPDSDVRVARHAFAAEQTCSAVCSEQTAEPAVPLRARLRVTGLGHVTGSPDHATRRPSHARFSQRQRRPS